MQLREKVIASIDSIRAKFPDKELAFNVYLTPIGLASISPKPNGVVFTPRPDWERERIGGFGLLLKPEPTDSFCVAYTENLKGAISL